MVRRQNAAKLGTLKKSQTLKGRWWPRRAGKVHGGGGAGPQPLSPADLQRWALLPWPRCPALSGAAVEAVGSAELPHCIAWALWEEAQRTQLASATAVEPEDGGASAGRGVPAGEQAVANPPGERAGAADGSGRGAGSQEGQQAAVDWDRPLGQASAARAADLLAAAVARALPHATPGTGARPCLPCVRLSICHRLRVEVHWHSSESISSIDTHA